MYNQLLKYQTLPIWEKDTLPLVFQEKHNTKEGTWAKLTILEGTLEFFQLDENGHILDNHLFTSSSEIPFIDPQIWHKVSPKSDDLRCYLEFYCLPENYFQKKYNLSAPHSEVIEVLNYIKSGDALDLGCGRGRNSFLMKNCGFNVTSLDHSEKAIATLQSICEEENILTEIKSEVYDIQNAKIKKHYDLIISTVVFQFLKATTIPNIIENMKEYTRIGGYNLIVAPISSDKFISSIDWPFTFKENELFEYYKDWKICKYNENIGEFHRKDENGNYYKSKFATLIAQKL